MVERWIPDPAAGGSIPSSLTFSILFFRKHMVYSLLHLFTTVTTNQLPQTSYHKSHKSSPAYLRHIVIISTFYQHHIVILSTSYRHSINIISSFYHHHIVILSSSYRHSIIIISTPPQHHICIILYHTVALRCVQWLCLMMGDVRERCVYKLYVDVNSTLSGGIAQW